MEVVVNCSSFSTAHGALGRNPGRAIARRFVLLVMILLLGTPGPLWAAPPPLKKQLPQPNHNSGKDPSGWLVIVGGGSLPDGVRNRFLELAGGKNARLVIIPTAHTQADHLETSASYPYW